jgi:hypothetical protein
VITLVLELNEVTGILKVLNDLPTSSGAWPLVQKIEKQAAPQLQKAEDGIGLTD